MGHSSPFLIMLITFLDLFIEGKSMRLCQCVSYVSLTEMDVHFWKYLKRREQKNVSNPKTGKKEEINPIKRNEKTYLIIPSDGNEQSDLPCTISATEISFKSL